jgi:hypothetical protein
MYTLFIATSRFILKALDLNLSLKTTSSLLKSLSQKHPPNLFSWAFNGILNDPPRKNTPLTAFRGLLLGF